MVIRLRYGRYGLPVKIPEDCQVTVIEKPVMPTIGNLARAAQSALDTAVGAPALRVLAEECDTACILVCDITRPVPNHILLPPILKTLLDAGIKPANILLLIATGLHRPSTDEELATILGEDSILNAIPVENHVGRAEDAHVDLGFSDNGTPIKIDRRFVQADLKLVTGLIEPHFMAGFSGGRKVIAPGIAHEDTIRTLHSSKFLSHQNCSVCQIVGNPLHMELLAIVERLRQHCGSNIYGVNVVIDADRQLNYVNFGEIETSHEEAMDFSRRFSVVNLDRQFPIVLSTAAGYPLDQTFYQAIKGLVAPLDIIEPNGTLILAAECTEGLGSPSFEQAQLKLCQDGTESFLESIKEKTQAAIDEWSTQLLAQVQQRTHIMLYSGGLSPAQFELTGAQRINSIELGLECALQAQERRELAVVPEGPYIVPKLRL